MWRLSADMSGQPLFLLSLSMLNSKNIVLAKINRNFCRIQEMFLYLKRHFKLLTSISSLNNRKQSFKSWAWGGGRKGESFMVSWFLWTLHKSSGIGPTFPKDFLQQQFQLKGKCHPRLNCFYVPQLDSLQTREMLPEGLKDKGKGPRSSSLFSFPIIHPYSSLGPPLSHPDEQELIQSLLLTGHELPSSSGQASFFN